MTDDPPGCSGSSAPGRYTALLDAWRSILVEAEEKPVPSPGSSPPGAPAGPEEGGRRHGDDQASH